jgi:tetratricopeptide (TPR) repeat protein
MRLRVNLRLLVALLVGVGLVAASVHLLHESQAQHTANALIEQAKDARQAEDLNRETALLQAYLGMRPNDQEVLSLLGRTMEQGAKSRDDRHAAKSTLERVVRQDPDDHDSRRALVRLEIAPDVRAIEDAHANLDILIRAFPDDGELEGLMGRCLEAENRPRDAAEWYARAIERDPSRIDDHARLAEIDRLHLGEAERADAVMERLVRLNEGSFRAHLARASYRLSFGIPGAAEDLARAEVLGPDEVDVFLAIGQVEEPAQAREKLERGIALHPKDERLYRRRAEVERRDGHPDAVVEQLRRGLEALPDQPELLLALADSEIEAGRLDNAEATIAGLRDRPIALELVDVLEGRLLMARGRWDDAARRLEQVQASLAKFEDTNTRRLTLRINLMLGRCYEVLQRPAPQLAAFKRALQGDPNSIVARAGVAAAQRGLGQIDDSIATYSALRRDLPMASVEIARIYIEATLAVPTEERRWAKAESALETAATEDPDSRDVALLQAEVALAKGQRDRARSIMEAAKARRPDDPALWIGLAQASAEEKGVDAGLAVLEDARAKFGDLLALRTATAGLLARMPGDRARERLAGLESGFDALPMADRVGLASALIAAYRRNGDLAGARRFAERLSRQLSDDAGLRLIQFELAYEDNDEAGAGLAARELRRIEGEDGVTWRYADALLLLGSLRSKPRDEVTLAQVRARLKEMAIRRPDLPQLPLLGALLADVTGDIIRAVEQYRRAVDLGMGEPRIVGRWAQLLASLGRDQEASQALDRLPRTSRLLGLPGQVAAELALSAGKPERARDLAQGAVPPEATNPVEHTWLGKLLRLSGAPSEEVESAFRRGVALSTNDPDAWVSLIRFLADDRRPAEAERAIGEARAKLPPDAGAIAAGLGYEAMGQRDQGERAFRDGLIARPAPIGVALAAAEFYMRGDRTDLAQPLLRELLGERQKSLGLEDAIRARRDLIVCLATRGDARFYDEAMALADANIRTTSNPEADGFLRAVVMAGHPGHRREAIAAIEAGDALRPLMPDELFLLFRLYDTIGEWTKARGAAQRLLEQQGNSPAYLAAYAASLMKHDQFDEAAPLVERLRRIDPKGPPATTLQARLLASRGRVPEAVDLLTSRARDDEGAVEVLALTLEQIGQPAQAELLLRQLASSPTAHGAGLALAAFLGRRGATRQAIEMLGDAWGSSPASLVAQVGLGVLQAGDRSDPTPIELFRKQLREAIAAHPKESSLPEALAFVDLLAGGPEAEASFRRMVASNPRDAAALNNLAWILSFQKERAAEALELANRAVQIAGPVPDLLDTRGVAALALGRAEQAIQDLEAAVAAKPDPAILFHLARAYDMAGRRDKSRAALDQARSRGLAVEKLQPAEREQYERLSVGEKSGRPAGPSAAAIGGSSR